MPGSYKQSTYLQFAKKWHPPKYKKINDTRKLNLLTKKRM